MDNAKKKKQFFHKLTSKMVSILNSCILKITLRHVNDNLQAAKASLLIAKFSF